MHFSLKGGGLWFFFSFCFLDLCCLSGVEGADSALELAVPIGQLLLLVAIPILNAKFHL